MTDCVVTNTNFGQIEGLKQQSALGCDYVSFLGVPFAKPPVGNLRFKVSKLKKIEKKRFQVLSNYLYLQFIVTSKIR